MKNKTIPIFLLAVTGLLFANTSHLSAQVIYSDAFTGTDGAVITGKTPSTTDLTGATYTGFSRGSGVPIYRTGAADTKYNGWVTLPLATGGSFTRAAGQAFSISADVAVNQLSGSGTVNNPPAGSTRGVGLGFYTVAAGTGGFNDPFDTDYTGFNLQTGGILQFVKNGVSTGFANTTVLPGTFSNTTLYTLTYSVDTSTGNLTSLFFNGANLTSTFATSAAGSFTTAQTAFAGFGGSSSQGNQQGGLVDNFSVAAVPEPSTWMMMLGGLGLLVGMQRLRSRKA